MKRTYLIKVLVILRVHHIMAVIILRKDRLAIIVFNGLSILIHCFGNRVTAAGHARVVKKGCRFQNGPVNLITQSDFTFTGFIAQIVPLYR